MRKVFILFISVLFANIINAQEKPEGLFINSKAADFKAVDQNGKEVNIKDLRKKGPVVIMFYRGYWCPFCSKALKRFQDSLSYITDKGATVIAVTPETQTFVDSTIAKTGASYSIISDKDMEISKKYAVVYKVDPKIVGRYKNADIDLLKQNDQKEAALPVPAVYIINRDGTISYRFFNEDYKKRPSVAEIAEAVTKIL